MNPGHVATKQMRTQPHETGAQTVLHGRIEPKIELPSVLGLINTAPTWKTP